MSTDSLNGIVGQPAHFAGDYLFRQQALPNTSTIYSEDYTIDILTGKHLTFQKPLTHPVYNDDIS